MNDGLVGVKPEGMGKMGDEGVGVISGDKDGGLDVDVDEELFVGVAIDGELVDAD